MAQNLATIGAGAATANTDNTNQLTNALLTGGVLAGPIYIIVGILQILIRPGFDLTRHELSLMSNGDLGWIQISNFILTGLLVIAGAIGIRRLLHGKKAGTWGALLVGLYGLGLIAAGIFVADPMNGFPLGTPATANTISWHGLLHFVTAAIGFVGLIAACFVFARRFGSLQQRGWAIYSALTGILFFAAFFGIASSGSKQAWINIAFTVAVILGWAWVSAICARLKSELHHQTN